MYLRSFVLELHQYTKWNLTGKAILKLKIEALFRQLIVYNVHGHWTQKKNNKTKNPFIVKSIHLSIIPLHRVYNY